LLLPDAGARRISLRGGGINNFAKLLCKSRKQERQERSRRTPSGDVEGFRLPIGQGPNLARDLYHAALIGEAIKKERDIDPLLTGSAPVKIVMDAIRF